MSVINDTPAIAELGSDLYYSLLTVASQQRQAIILVHQFYQTMLQLLLNCREWSVTEVKLKWWQDQLLKLPQQAVDHPLLQQLQPYVNQFNLSVALFEEMRAAVETYLASPVLSDSAALHHHLGRFAGARENLTMTVLQQSVKPSQLLPIAIGLALTVNIQQLTSNAAQGYHFLPQDLWPLPTIEFADASVQQPLSVVLSQQLQQARQLLSIDASLPKMLRVRMRLALTLLKKIEKHHCQVWQQTLSVMPLKKLFLAWSC